MNELTNLGSGKGHPRGPWEIRVLLWAIGIAAVAVVSVVAAYFFDEYTESDSFCGLICHTNYPQYGAKQISSHASVRCGECHIGPGLTPKVMAKVYGIGELYSLATDSFERPLEPPVARMRPAEEICEHCHSPGLTYPDQFHLVSKFAHDETNSESTTRLMVWVSEREGGARVRPGAHWHIDNPVQFIAVDGARQHIPWVGVSDGDQLVEYRADGSQLSTAELDQLPVRTMDCMDCHNRDPHPFLSPERLLDEALASGQVDASLPFVKREGMKLLATADVSQEAGVEAMSGLRDFFDTEYADVAKTKTGEIDQAVEALQEIYSHTTFPRMNVTWEAYDDDSAHQGTSGCFRCHDGQHLDAEQNAIPSDCTTCHSVPVTSGPGQALELALLASLVPQYDSPESHKSPDFRWEHRILAGDSCVDCHGPMEYGTDDSSFCANSICHGQEWPDSVQELSFEHAVDVLIGNHGQAQCYDCHGVAGEPDDEACADCHQPPSDPHLGPGCADCHTPEGWRESSIAWVDDAVTIPHRITAELECLSCHGPDQASRIPENHREFPAQSCSTCHDLGVADSVPPIPHETEGRSDCLTCHGSDLFAPVPDDHAGRSNESCLLCHEAEDSA